MTINKRKAKKDALIHQAATLFTQRGYYNTSIADIAEQCQLKKASIYNYIISKEQLAQDSLQQVHDYLNEHLFCLTEANEETENKLLKVLQTIETYFTEHEEAMLYLKLSLDLSQEPAFEKRIKQHFDAWFNLFNKLLQQLGHSLDQAQALAKQTLAELHGAILLSKIFNNPQMIKNFCRRLYNTLQPSRIATMA